ncbi:YjbH domain-containing protein (plasmid) [Sulfitobacter sp. W027]|uniref:YjbH domain-containing protein n=1 Tax=Sulfitobacter sp. W027 TaxID=2867025 RepID=UPI0021A45CAF|nr:YjbH domain-containing protein [Sulfitobacter sp. W027]UWR35714.1 YjbH domain-containing protein [Sulfitobacter sp. W027]
MTDTPSEKGGSRRRTKRAIIGIGIVLLPAAAQTQGSSYTTYGTVGLIDIPTAQSAEDAELAATYSRFGNTARSTLSFQITPRLAGSFRYSKIEDFSTGGALFDRSFDLRYRVLDETPSRPAIAVGLQDFIGTGVYSGEYIVATKSFSPRLTFSGGIGWGRLASYKGFSNPLGALDDRFDSRPDRDVGRGGEVEATGWFRGDAALFGGVAWAATDKLTLKAEYSSDAYLSESRAGSFEHKSPFNFGVDYQVRDNVNLQAHYLYGSELGFTVSLLTNPRRPAANGGTGTAPLPVQRRAPGAASDLGWTQVAGVRPSLRKQTDALLASDGMALEAMTIGAQAATVHIRNDRYLARPEAIGRSARILTRVLPASVETFTIVPVENGIALSAITLNRSDIENLEHAPDGAWQSYARADIADAADSLEGASYDADTYPKLTWSLGPYLNASYFDPDEPVRVNAGLRLQGRYDIAPGWFVSGSVEQRVVGNIGDADRPSDSVIPRVRSESALYAREGETSLEHLTLAHYFRPGEDFYGRVTAGYLESQFGGVSSEVLWKPVASRLALGAEVNYAVQRDFDQGFGFRDYEVATGHLSAYYDFGNGYLGQVDAGRYLAGDYGATFTLDRVFANGWSVGAYATLTDVSFDDFGEGSFDKGLRFTVPLSHILGKPTDDTYKAVIQPLTRDGGARLKVRDRLYDSVRSYHTPEMKDNWGRFWR